MKKKIKLAAISFLSLFLIYSCEKEEANTNTTKKQSTLTELFKNIAPPMQNFTVTAGQFQQIVGEKGTTISFYANSFKKKDGTILTNGSVKIVLQEMLTGPEMILAGKSTTSDGKLLVSGGQIYIKAYLGSEELRVNQAAKPLISIPTEMTGDMKLFVGSVKEKDSVAGDTIINWQQDTTTVRRRQDSSGVKIFNEFECDSFRFINCDYFYSDPNPKTDVKITVPTGFVDSNTQVMVFFPSINSVARVYQFENSGNYFILNNGYQVPVGMQAKIVVISKQGNQYYFQVKTVTISANINESMTPTASTEAAIKLAIKSL